MRDLLCAVAGGFLVLVVRVCMAIFWAVAAVVVIPFAIIAEICWLVGLAGRAFARGWRVIAPGFAHYVAALLGIAGAVVLAIPGINPAWGFGAWFGSNIGWMLFSVRQRHWGLFAQYAVFLLISVGGIWNWWLGPLVLG